MGLIREWLQRLGSLVRPRRSDADIEAELRAHVQLAEGRGVASSADVLPALEAVRDQRDLSVLRDVVRDVRYAVRGFIREPGFSVVAIFSLALGIGANTAVFSLVDAVLLHELPVQRPGELVFLSAVGSNGRAGAPPYVCFERFRQETTAFDRLSAFATDQLRIETGGGLEQVYGQVASGNYFELLGVEPAAGRLLTADDERLDPPVAVIGYAYWQRRFGGDRRAIGARVSYEGRTFTIVGVTPPEFTGLEPGRVVDLTLPITVDRESMADEDDWWMQAIGRLTPSASRQAATAQLNVVFHSFMEGRGSADGQRAKYFDHMELQPAAQGDDWLRARFATSLYGLGAIAGLVLIIACANLSSLQLVRGVARGRELAIRLATGAGRGRIFRQLLTETFLLFLAGTALAVMLAQAAVVGLTRVFLVGRTPIRIDAPIDWRLLAFAAITAFAAAIPTALWPAIRALRTEPERILREGAHRTAGSRRVSMAARWLVSAQFGISFVLLVSAVLFGRTILNLRHTNMGFSGDEVVTMSIEPVTGDDAQARLRIWTRMLERVRAVPGVSSASLSVMTPLSGRDSSTGITVAGFEPRDPDDTLIHVNHVSDEYFRTFGIAMRTGRGFTREDRAAAARNVVLNEAAAALYFPGSNPIGQLVRFGPGTAPYEVIGVAANHKHATLREQTPRMVFVPIWQPFRATGRLTLAAASALPTATLVRQLDQEIHVAHAKTLVSEVMRVRDQIDATLISERLLSTLALVFAVIAVTLAGIGVYGVLSYSVVQRRTEFGIHMALGATPARVARDLLRQIAIGWAVAIAVAIPAALAGARLSQSMLFGVDPKDAGHYVLSAILLAVIASVAALRPTYRACAIPPSETLRHS